MNGWHNAERQAQISYGREQMINNDGTSSRPIGYTGGSYQSGDGNCQDRKPRQFGGGERSHFQGNSRNNFQGNDRNGFQGQLGGLENLRPQYERERGHMAFLKSLQRSGSPIRLVTILEEEVIGTLKDCDETTITVKVPKPTEANPHAYLNRIFIKHNLVEFAPVVEGVAFN